MEISHLKTNPLKFDITINQGFLQVLLYSERNLIALCAISIEDKITS